MPKTTLAERRMKLLHKADAAYLELVKAIGGKRILCDWTGLKLQALQHWRRIPVEPNWVLEIEAKAMAFGFDRYRMRPDVYGSRPKDVKAPVAQKKAA